MYQIVFAHNSSRGQRPNESQKALIIDMMKSVGVIASEIWPVLRFLPIFGKIWPWLLTLTKGQGHQHLGHWMHLIGLYLGTKYEVCRWSSLQDMTSSLVFYHIWQNLTLTFDLDQRSRSSALRSLNAPYWVYLGTK